MRERERQRESVSIVHKQCVVQWWQPQYHFCSNNKKRKIKVNKLGVTHDSANPYTTTSLTLLSDNHSLQARSSSFPLICSHYSIMGEACTCMRAYTSTAGLRCAISRDIIPLPRRGPELAWLGLAKPAIYHDNTNKLEILSYFNSQQLFSINLARVSWRTW